MGDPNEPTREEERPADQTSGAGYGNNAEGDAPAGVGAEERPDEL